MFLVLDHYLEVDNGSCKKINIEQCIFHQCDQNKIEDVEHFFFQYTKYKS